MFIKYAEAFMRFCKHRDIKFIIMLATNSFND